MAPPSRLPDSGISEPIIRFTVARPCRIYTGFPFNPYVNVQISIICACDVHIAGEGIASPCMYLSVQISIIVFARAPVDCYGI